MIGDGTAPAMHVPPLHRRITWQDTDRVLKRAEARGIRFVIPGDDEWPTDQIADLAALSEVQEGTGGVPLGLWIRGRQQLNKIVRRGVTVSGTTVPSAYGSFAASEISFGLASAGCPVWSSGSVGIDEAGHRGVLASDSGVPVAVLPSGLDVRHPHHRDVWLDMIAERGAVVSQFPPTVLVTRARATVSRWLCCALTTAVVVIETGRRGAQHSLARSASALQRPVFAVPGPIGSAPSAGCHQLIMDGTAKLITTATDILDCLDTGSADAGGEDAGPRSV
ncbi:hypothetical protein GCM10022222_84440 [Amycolatopsis ultiminotia]|uniref:Smf/DprA SLOG domain-containing protein n=1 Tax=Amycolatopsis ultiminotia TaxID=543629 RepID=A0ABP6YMR9_9PSEU